jgi:type I restriction enzyme, S subunit
LLARHPSWERVPLQNVARVLNGEAFKSKLFSKEKGFPLIRIRDLSRSRSETFYTGPYDPQFIVNPRDLLIGMDGDFACYEWQGQPGLLNQRVCKVIPDEHTLHRKFLFFGINGYLQAIKDATSSQTVTHLSSRDLLRIPFPLPSIPEQERIVAKVEALLARVNAARQRLAKVPAILNRFRQSVLAAACSGRLTAVWREEVSTVNPELLHVSQLAPIGEKTKRRAGRLWGGGEVPDLTDEERESLPDPWVWRKVGELGNGEDEAVQVGPMSMQSREFRDSGIPVLNVGCIQWGFFDKSKLDYLPESKAGSFSRYRIRPGDILFTRSGTIGRCAVASEKERDYLMTFHLLRVRPGVRCLSQFLCFVFQGAPHIRRQMEEAAIGSTRAGFNTNLLAGLDVPLPSIPEQQEIVRRVEALFQLADAIEKRVAAATARAEKLTQAILAKAFRGELVPTEAELARREGREYEPASALLERIQMERSHNDDHTRRTTRKRIPRRPRQPKGRAQ